jgi:hypothetical protein
VLDPSTATGVASAGAPFSVFAASPQPIRAEETVSVTNQAKFEEDQRRLKWVAMSSVSKVESRVGPAGASGDGRSELSRYHAIVNFSRGAAIFVENPLNPAADTEEATR